LDGAKAFGRRIAVEQAQESPSEDRKKKIERSNYKKKDRKRK
jgi:hypothetical protein